MTFDSRAAAKAWLTATEADLQRNSWIDPRHAVTKLDAVAARWLAADHTKRPGSLARDNSILKTHVLPNIGGYGIGAVTRGDIQQLVNGWVARYSPSTVLRHYACLRGLFSYAQNCELILRSPCRNLRLPAVAQREAMILDGAQLEALAGAMGPSGPMIYLAAMGLRWGEIAGLRVGRLDFLRRTVTVVTQRTRGERGRMIEQDPKTRAGHRSLGVPKWTMNILAEHLAQRGMTGDDPEALVFVSPTGEPLHYANWRRRTWLPALAQLGFSNLTFHDLKHTAATALVEAGVDVKTAQVRLGHASPQTTLKVYAQVTDRADRKAADKVGERFRPSAEALSAPRDATVSQSS